MNSLPYLHGRSCRSVMTMEWAHEIATAPHRFTTADHLYALTVLSARVRAMEATVITGCACCDEDQPKKTLSPAEVFEIMKGW